MQVATLTVPACLQPLACAGPASTSPCTDTRPRGGMSRKRGGGAGGALGPAPVVGAGGSSSVPSALVYKMRACSRCPWAGWRVCAARGHRVRARRQASSGWGIHERGGGCVGGEEVGPSPPWTTAIGASHSSSPNCPELHPNGILQLHLFASCLPCWLLRSPTVPFCIFLSMTSSKPSMRERGD